MAILDPERGWSISFSGCGFLGCYHLGVGQCLRERAPHILNDARMIFGASGGALGCVFLLSDLSLESMLHIMMDMIRWTRRRNLSTLHPTVNLMEYMRHGLHKHLSPNIHEMMSGRGCVSLTRVTDGKNVLVSDFQSKQEVIDALLCSCFIPFYCGWIPPTFRGERYIDGGLTDNVPFFDDKTTITVCPFYGEGDICPKNTSSNYLLVDHKKLALRFCSENIYLAIRSMLPPNLKVCAEICLRGYLDAVKFLEENGICDKPQRGLCPSSEELEAGRTLETPGRVAPALEPEKDELIEHMRRSLSQWDERFLEILSPRLVLGLRDTIQEQDGPLSRLWELLDVVLLPCTLPVESAIAIVRRFTLWIPDIPEDVRWLRWASSRAGSKLMGRLFPAVRSPAPGSQPEPTCLGAADSGHPSPPSSPTDPHAHPVDFPVGTKARVPQASFLQPGLTLLGGQGSDGGVGDPPCTLSPLEKTF